MYLCFQTDTVYGYDIPLLKMLKRQIRNNRDDRKTSITMVFRSTVSVHVRWFRRATNNSLILAELINMLPISEGNSTNIMYDIVYAICIVYLYRYARSLNYQCCFLSIFKCNVLQYYYIVVIVSVYSFIIIYVFLSLCLFLV